MKKTKIEFNRNRHREVRNITVLHRALNMLSRLGGAQSRVNPVTGRTEWKTEEETNWTPTVH
jgi:hypothetical protein